MSRESQLTACVPGRFRRRCDGCELVVLRPRLVAIGVAMSRGRIVLPCFSIGKRASEDLRHNGCERGPLGLLPMLDRCAGITFDLAKLEFITSAGLRTLLVVYKVMSRRETPMRVVNMSGSVLELFDSIGFSGIYGIERTE